MGSRGFAVLRAAIACVVFGSSLAGVLVPAAAADGTTEQATAGLDDGVQATWTRVPLREWTVRISSLAGRPVILDRRIDPDRLVTHTARGESVRDVLQAVAAEAGATVEELPGAIRLVPPAVGGRGIAAASDRARRLAALSPAQRKPLTEVRSWSWPAGAQPRVLLADALAEAGLSVEGLDAVAHDHFPAAALPPLALAERLDLVLANFDLRILWSANRDRPAGRIVAIDADVAPQGGGTPRPRTGPDAARRPGPAPNRPVKLRDEFTLRLEAPLDQALAAIAGRLGLTLELDAASLAARGIAPGEIVRAEVEKASRTELLDALVRPLGLEWTIAGDRLRVFAPAAASAPK